MNKPFQPKVIGFLCNWCSYAGADMAGTSRMKQETNLRIIRVPCSGRVDPLLVLKSFQRGADGVMILGCHPGDCHYNEGNYHARRKLALFTNLIDYLGIDRDRIKVDWVSATEGKKFVEVVSNFVTHLSEMGPRSEK